MMMMIVNCDYSHLHWITLNNLMMMMMIVNCDYSHLHWITLNNLMMMMMIVNFDYSHSELRFVATVATDGCVKFVPAV